jgi:hypothetical protein
VLNEANPGPCVQLTMNLKFGNFFESLWSRPDPVLADAGVAGELLVAKIRLSLAIFLLLIPLINWRFFPVDRKEGLVGLGLTARTFLLALAVYLMISRGYNSSWLRFATSAFDVTLVSSALVLFLLLNQPHTAVNSKVVFEGYFLVMGSASLRYDKRVCITTVLLAFAQYFAIVYFTASHWDLNNHLFALSLWLVQLVRTALAVDHHVDGIGAEPGAGFPQPKASADGDQRSSDGLIQPGLRGRSPRDRTEPRAPVWQTAEHCRDRCGPLQVAERHARAFGW